ncbi:lipopolysaccharide heptosyltransferase II [Candidatus Omnitrophota bacterium]
MNILQILPELNIGGVETGTLDLAKELIKQGHKAVVISNGGELVKELERCGGVHYVLPVHEKSPITIFSMVSKIKEIIEREDISIVHARSRAPAFSAFLAARAMKVAFITTCHGHYSPHIFSRVMGWGKYIIVSSNVVARHMINNFGVPRSKIRLIPRGVDTRKFTYKEADQHKKKREYIVGLIGRITPIKGHVHLIRAISKVIRFMPNVKVLVIGDAPSSKPGYRNELQALTKRLGLSKYIQFIGERHDIPQQLKKMDLLIMPSVGEETFGRVIIEAQSSGVPVIASRVGGIIDIIEDGENGLLVNPADWSGLSDAIIKVLKDKDLRKKLSVNGRRSVVKKFSLSQMYIKTLDVYKEAISDFRILIMKWSALGDIILSLPALKAIREHFPKARIRLITSNQGRGLLSRYPYVDEFIIFQGFKGIRGIKEILDISSETRGGSADIAIDLQNNKKSHLFAFLSCAPRRIGYKTKKLDFLLNEKVVGQRMEMSPIKHQFKILKTIGINSIPKSCEFIVSDSEIEYADRLLAEGWVAKKQLIVGLNCGSSKRWKTKRWPTRHLAKLCDLLAQKRVRVVITGNKDDKNEAENIMMLANSKPLDLTGKTDIMELAAIIKRCAVFVTPDSAPMHIAALMGVPFVALFGATDPKRHLEPSEQYRVIYKDLKCAPCYKTNCDNKKCMEDITPEEVISCVEELIG